MMRGERNVSTGRLEIENPKEDATLSGSQTIEMFPIQIGAPVISVRFLVDGTEVAVFGTVPYRYEWDTRRASNGKHVIAGITIDAAGYAAVTHRNVYVQN